MYGCRKIRCNAPVHKTIIHSYTNIKDTKINVCRNKNGEMPIFFSHGSNNKERKDNAILKHNSSVRKLTEFLSSVKKEKWIQTPMDSMNYEVDILPFPIQRSIEMRDRIDSMFQKQLGTGLWHDMVASPLARCLDSDIVYNAEQQNDQIMPHFYQNKYSNQTLKIVTDKSNKDGSNLSKNEQNTLDVTYENLTPQSNTTIIPKNSNNDIKFTYDPYVHSVANKLQNIVKRRYTVITMNQIKISSFYRSFLLRRETEMKRKNVKIIQKYWRKQFQTRLRAAKIILLFCIRTNRQKELLKSIIMLQSFSRMILPRKSYSNNKVVNKAVFVIQHQWWKWSCKRFLSGLVDSVIMRIVTVQATIISSYYRRHQSQKKADFIRRRNLHKDNQRKIQELNRVNEAISFSLVSTTFLMYSELVSPKKLIIPYEFNEKMM